MQYGEPYAYYHLSLGLIKNERSITGRVCGFHSPKKRSLPWT